MNDQYIICWKSIVTGNTGRGTASYPKAIAESIVYGANKSELFSPGGAIEHWIEPAPEKEQP